MDNVSKGEFLRLSRRVKEIPVQAELISAVKRSLYRVGDIIISVSPDDPAGEYGGAWELFGSGKVLVGIDKSATPDADFDTAGETGGHKQVTLVAANVQNHTHRIIWDPAGAQQVCSLSGTDKGGGAVSGYRTGYESGTVYNESMLAASRGANTPVNIMQPYIVVYMWKRTK